jgi:hypothetical protein
VTSPPTRSAFLVQIHIYLRHTDTHSPKFVVFCLHGSSRPHGRPWSSSPRDAARESPRGTFLRGWRSADLVRRACGAVTQVQCGGVGRVCGHTLLGRLTAWSVCPVLDRWPTFRDLLLEDYEEKFSSLRGGGHRAPAGHSGVRKGMQDRPEMTLMQPYLILLLRRT